MPLTTSSLNGRAEALEVAPNGAEPQRTKVVRVTSDASRKHARSVAKQQQAAERIAAATAEISSQNAQANQAAQQLKEAMQQIAAGSEEMSGASQESMAAVAQIEERIGRQMKATQQVEEFSRTVQRLLGDTTLIIQGLLNNVGEASDRQNASVKTISELEKQADEIGEIVKTVAHIADQTNLLALNAAIEAARARQHGKGFAVVADEVRTLAETSERSASQIRDLIDEIRRGVNDIAAEVQQSAEVSRGEVEKGKEITAQLDRVRDDTAEIMKGTAEMAAAAIQSEKAAADAKVRSEEIAAAAEEQSAACEESLQSIVQQGTALAQSHQATEDLAELAEGLRGSTDVSKSAAEVAAAAEELSASVEEINRAATQISTAVNQIATASRNAATKSQESAGAASQIEQGAQLAANRGDTAVQKVENLIELLAENKTAVDSMIEAIASSSRASAEHVRKVGELELVSRRIDKIVDAIANVSIQTNMLAVNGSVESARAGEFGKGFAVVSTDIRNLARDSAENADRIKDLIKAVQDRIVEVRVDLEQTSRQALSEVTAAKAATERLVEIEEDMARVREGNREVRDAAQEIAVAVGQVKTGLDQISTAATQADQLTAQAAAAAKQQAQGAEDLAAAVEEISALADELQNA